MKIEKTTNGKYMIRMADEQVVHTFGSLDDLAAFARDLLAAVEEAKPKDPLASEVFVEKFDPSVQGSAFQTIEERRAWILANCEAIVEWKKSQATP